MRTDKDMSWIYKDNIPFESLLGATLLDFEELDDRVSFLTDKGRYTLINFESWCGNDCDVSLEDIDGNIYRLFGQKIIFAEEIIHSGTDESTCYSFYKLSTNNDSVTLRFYGRSNGYYSENMQLYKENN
ncbi:MAG TPA: hypothetical protein DEG71_07310 [Clostridiales bacterium]|nr:hypothetical protein [Clostridiales bacterium]